MNDPLENYCRLDSPSNERTLSESLYPEKLLVSVPLGTREALKQASRAQHLTTTAYLRRIIEVALQVDGVS